MNRDIKSNKIWLIKSSAIIILLVCILIKDSGLSFYEYANFINIQVYTSFLGIKWYIWLLGYIFSFIIAWFLHLISYTNVSESKITFRLLWRGIEEEKTTIDNRVNFIKYLCLKILSPDYAFASSFKNILFNEPLSEKCPRREGEGHYYHEIHKYIQCEEKSGEYNCEIHNKGNKRKDFVIFSNWGNVILACTICIFVAFSLKGDIFYTFLVFHLLSRIIEVVLAFYKDVVRTKMNSKDLSIGYKSSNLKRGNRISLAIHSYVEFILLFSCVYFLANSHINTNFDNNSMTSFLDFILYSMSVSAYNFSLDLGATTYGKLVHVCQVFTSMTLIVLSLATYIGMKDEKMSIYEIIEWREHKEKKKVTGPSEGKIENK